MSEKGNINFLTADGNQEHNKKYLKYLFHWGIRSISYRLSDFKN